MSSHHIIREKQEPALLILSIDHFDEEYLGQLLEWSPTVIVKETIYEHIVPLGIKIDLIIADENLAHDLQEHTKIIYLGEDEPVNCGLKYLVSEVYPSVNIICDHFLSKDYLFFVELIDLVVFADGKKIFPVKSGFTKWKPADENIFILTEAHPISFSGLTQISDHQYRTIKDGFYGFIFNQPFVFLGEEL